MNNTTLPSRFIRATSPGRPKLTVLRAAAVMLALAGSPASHAIDFGPDGMFSLYGFAEALLGQSGSYCLNCQVADPNYVGKQLRAADAIIPGKNYDTRTTAFWQIQPALSANYRLAGGYKLSATLEQRWRDGTVSGAHEELRYGGKLDVPGYWYQKNVGLSHEDYGSVRVGAMTSRAWSVADAPYGSNLSMSDAWGATGAGYGMLTRSVRLGSRTLDFAQGDLFLEFTYDMGKDGFSRLKPKLFELYGQYHKGDLVVDTVLQTGINGGPSAWAHAPFVGVTSNPSDENQLAVPGSPAVAGNRQSVAIAMARYQIDSKVEVSGGIRRNAWSGSNVFFSAGSTNTSAFNVDYSNPLGALVGYPATSVDLLLGLRYRMNKWVISTGAVYLGTASTNNPSERGQSNSALINTLGLKYDYGNGFQWEGTAGHVHFDRLGLSPMSLTGNSYNNVDSRISTNGSWLTLGCIYNF